MNFQHDLRNTNTDNKKLKVRIYHQLKQERLKWLGKKSWVTVNQK